MVFNKRYLAVMVKASGTPDLASPVTEIHILRLQLLMSMLKFAHESIGDQSLVILRIRPMKVFYLLFGEFFDLLASKGKVQGDGNRIREEGTGMCVLGDVGRR